MPAREHTGVCRHIEQFRDRHLARLAKEIESDLGRSFRPHGVQLRVLPIQITHLLSVGEGVALDLKPEDVAARGTTGATSNPTLRWAVSPRLSRAWHQKLSLSEVESWLRKEARSYLAELEAASATAS